MIWFRYRTVGDRVLIPLQPFIRALTVVRIREPRCIENHLVMPPEPFKKDTRHIDLLYLL
jgi:hypothetical protein